MNAMSVLRVSDYDLSLYGVLAIVKGASETLVNDRFLALSMVSESSQSFLETLLCASTYAEFFICSEQSLGLYVYLEYSHESRLDADLIPDFIIDLTIDLIMDSIHDLTIDLVFD